VAFVSANIGRRHLTKGQQAMALAMIYPEGQQGRGKNEQARKARKILGFSDDMLRVARYVLRRAPERAKVVMAGGFICPAISRTEVFLPVATGSEASNCSAGIEASCVHSDA